MVESFVVPTEILQRPKKKNIIFEKIVFSRFISTSVFISTEILVFISAAKTTTKTIKLIQ